MSEVAVLTEALTEPVVPPTLDELKVKREAAWRAFNPNFPSSNENDWVKFALANSKWRTAYRRAYGQEPAPDAIEEESSACYNLRRHGSPKEEVASPHTDAERSKTNERRRAK